MDRKQRSVSRERKAALSLRAIEREYGISREYVGALVHAGTIPALRRGRALIVLRIDFESWWHAECAKRQRPIDARIEAVLDREEARAASG